MPVPHLMCEESAMIMHPNRSTVKEKINGKGSPHHLQCAIETSSRKAANNLRPARNTACFAVFLCTAFCGTQRVYIPRRGIPSLSETFPTLTIHTAAPLGGNPVRRQRELKRLIPRDIPLAWFHGPILCYWNPPAMDCVDTLYVRAGRDLAAAKG